MELRTRNPRRLGLAGLAVALFTAAAGFAITFSGAGTPSAPSRAPLLVPVPFAGKLDKVIVHEGDAVRQGQLVALLDSSAYEAELKKAESELEHLQSQTQSAIMPMSTLPGMSGLLPQQLPQVEYVSVPVAARTRPALPSMPPVPTSKASAASKDLYKEAFDGQASARSQHEHASQALAKASAEVVEAQKARDVLRPKITEAESDATQAERKAAAAKELLDQGAISEKRSSELIAERESTAKAVSAVRLQIAEADKALDAAKARQLEAQRELDAATAKLKSADELLTRAASVLPTTRPESRKAPERMQPQPVAQTTKIVMKKMRLPVRASEPPPIPVKVVVDEKAMKGSQLRLAELKQRIETLKKRIEECKIHSPATGFVHVTAAGQISIRIAS